MKITAIIENTSLPSINLDVEPGLALYIENMNQKILFDTGVSIKMLENAKKLNIPLEDVDICVISHGHFDHTGGLKKFLTINSKAKVYMRKGADGQFFFKIGFINKYIGAPPTIFENFKDRIIFIDKNTEALPGLHLITSINRTRPLAKGNLKLKQRTPSGIIQDEFQHELVMALKDVNNEFTLVTGCSHNGVLNMIDSVKNYIPSIKINTILGGFHLMGIPIFKNSMGSTPEEVRDIARELQTYNMNKIYTMHCTGMKAFGILKAILGDSLDYLPGGKIIETR